MGDGPTEKWLIVKTRSDHLTSDATLSELVTPFSIHAFSDQNYVQVCRHIMDDALQPKALMRQEVDKSGR